MKRFAFSLGLAFAGIYLTTLNLSAADSKQYQVTGPVLEVTPTYLVVQKGDEKWQVGVDKNTKNATVKVGDKVTIYYRMVATEVEVKGATKSDKPEKAKKPTS